MKRLLVLGVAACGAPMPRAPSPAPAPATDERPVIPRSSEIVDTSIAGVWAAPPDAHLHVPRAREPAVAPYEPGLEAIAMPRARVPGRRAPCFAKRDVLVADEIWRDLHAYAIGMESMDPPRGTYGTCTIEDGELRDAHGTLIAELGCGLWVHTPGIIDDFGFEIGASGSDVAAKYPTDDTVCWGYDETHTRCWFQTQHGSDSAVHYIVAGVLEKDDREPVRGAAARGFFTSRTISSWMLRGSCH